MYLTAPANTNIPTRNANIHTEIINTSTAENTEKNTERCVCVCVCVCVCEHTQPFDNASVSLRANVILKGRKDLRVFFLVFF